MREAEHSVPSITSADFGIYVHFPLCLHRCGYCEFATVSCAGFPHRQYAEAVLREMAARRAAFARGRLRAIYFGGGTPSLWPAQEIARVVSGACELFGEAEEVSLEANPECFDLSIAQGLVAAGITRLSLGIQSTDDVTLRRLDRRHDAGQVTSAVDAAKRAGFHQVSGDMIFGLRGQSTSAIEREIDALLELDLGHVSTYALTLSRGCALRRAGARVVDDDRSADLMQAIQQRLEAAGLLRYEVANFARAGQRCLHHRLTWSGQPYLGLGASAHSMLWDGAGCWRMVNPPFPRYLQAVPSVASGDATRQNGGRIMPARLEGTRAEAVSPVVAGFELLMSALRTTSGLDRKRYVARFAADPLVEWPALEELCRGGLLSIDAAAITPTERGLCFADEVALRLLPAAHAHRLTAGASAMRSA